MPVMPSDAAGGRGEAASDGVTENVVRFVPWYLSAPRHLSPFSGSRDLKNSTRRSKKGPINLSRTGSINLSKKDSMNLTT